MGSAKRETAEKKKIAVGVKIILVLLLLLVVLLTAYLIMYSSGKQKLYATAAGAEAIDIGETAGLKENQILYNGQVYALNQDLITILVMGIDKETVREIGGQSWSADEAGEYVGGQADALFLMLMNPHDKTVSIIAINRNAMTDIDVFDEEGNYSGRFTKQIALQHGYGDGQEESCERQVTAVSRMFHNIPIHGYAAISMDAIPELNDAVGGVTVEVLEDMSYPEYNVEFHQGDTITLSGEEAYWYVRLRNEEEFNSNEQRLQRQKQFLTTFAAEAKHQATSDIRVAVNLYQVLQDYMVTDIDLNSFTYLATEAISYDFDINSMYSLQGEVIQGNRFEEFYVDDDALQELIVELFYEPVQEES